MGAMVCISHKNVTEIPEWFSHSDKGHIIYEILSHVHTHIHIQLEKDRETPQWEKENAHNTHVSIDIGCRVRKCWKIKICIPNTSELHHHPMWETWFTAVKSTLYKVSILMCDDKVLMNERTKTNQHTHRHIDTLCIVQCTCIRVCVCQHYAHHDLIETKSNDMSVA